jgi:ELWxxDGT repeat protein
VREIAAAGGSNPDELTEVNGTLFFRASDGVSGSELWKATVEGPGPAILPDIADPVTKKKKCKKKKKKGKKSEAVAAKKKCKKKKKKKKK